MAHDLLGHLASFRVLLIMVTLVAEPLTQQYVIYRTRMISDNIGIASIRRSNVCSVYMDITIGKNLRYILVVLLRPL